MIWSGVRLEVCLRVLILRPSDVVAELDIGDTFTLEDGSRYILLARDPWQATVSSFTKFDEFILNFIDRLISLFRRCKTK